MGIGDTFLNPNTVVGRIQPVPGPAEEVPFSQLTPALLTALALPAGASQVGFLPSGTGAAPRPVQTKLREIVSVTDFYANGSSGVTVTGDGTTDDSGGIRAADVAVAARGRKGAVFFPAPSVGYNCTSALTQSAGVEWLGEEWGWTNLAGSAFVSGVQIIKSHNSDCITIPQSVGNRISNIAIRSDKATYTTGNGITIGKGVEARLERIAVFTVGGDGIVVGDNSVDSYHCYLTDCYVNNPGARAYVIGSKWFKGNGIRSDGGTIGCELLTSAQEFNLHNFHFEGWSANGIKCSGGLGHTSGHNVLNNSVGGALTAILMVNVSGAQIIEWDRIEFISAFNSGSIALNIAGAQNTHIKLTRSIINNYGIGVSASGDKATIERNLFSGCQNAFSMVASSNFQFCKNRVEGTTDTKVGLFTSGSNCRFDDNDLDKQLHTSGTILNSTNTARRNKGWVTSNSGQTGGITSGTAIAHGLVDTPAAGGVPAPVSYTSGVTSTQLSTIDATNITFTWTGTATVQWGWSARCVCDP